MWYGKVCTILHLRNQSNEIRSGHDWAMNGHDCPRSRCLEASMEGERQAWACFRTRVASMPLARINHALQSLRKILHADRVAGQVRALSCNPTAWQILIKHSPFPYHHFPRKSTPSQSETWPPRYEQCCLFPRLGGQSQSRAPALYLRWCGGFLGRGTKEPETVWMGSSLGPPLGLTSGRWRRTANVTCESSRTSSVGRLRYSLFAMHCAEDGSSSEKSKRGNLIPNR